MDDGRAFLDRLEQSVQDGNADHIEANIPRLRELIRLYMERSYELAGLQERARLILMQHEPPADKRIER